MKKFFKFLVLAILILPATILFSACGSTTIVDIKKTSSTDVADTYTIYYSDGTKSSITVQNGKDADSIDVEALYQLGVTKGYYTDDLDGFQKFLNDLVTKREQTTQNLSGMNLAMQSVVSVYAKFPTNDRVYPNKKSAITCGAGVIYKMDTVYSYIITNYHVLYYTGTTNSSNLSDEVYVYQYGVDESILLTDSEDDYVISGDAVACDYIGGSMQYDIAVLRVRTQDLISHNANARAVDVANNYTLGQNVYAIGNPEGNGISVTRGVVSVESEMVEMTGADNVTDIDFRVLRIDAAVNGGNSGGGLFDENGKLVGIVNAKLVYSSDNTPIDGVAYALPMSNATKVADNLIHYYSTKNRFTSVYRITLGISYKTQNTQQVYNPITGELSLKDSLVLAADPDSNTIAYELKLKTGDIVTHFKINDKTYELTRSFNLGDLLLDVRAGDTISLSYTRDGLSSTTGDYVVRSTDLKTIG